MSSAENPLTDRANETAGPPPPPPPSHPPRIAQPQRPRRRFWVFGLLLLLLVLTTGGLFYWWEHSRVYVSTDNVYVVGNITPIASDVAGQVVALFIDDNMIVQPGDPIAQIDPVPFQMKVDQALADYKQAASDADAADITVNYTTDDRKSLLEGAQAKQAEAEKAVQAAEVAVQTHTKLDEKDEEVLASLKAQLPGLEALRQNAKYYYERFKSLAKTGDVPIQEFDNREAAYRDAIAKVEALQSNIKAAEREVLASHLKVQEARVRLEQSRKTLNNAIAEVGRATAAQLQPKVAANTAVALRNKKALAEARLRLAKLDLSNTLIRAPRAGIISRRTIQVGQTVEIHKPFLSITPLDLDNVWVVANLREEQMTRVRVGQPATISVDGIPERTFDGWVESVSGGTGAVFSLFPPDNATGNFVRVVQRLPVRVRFSDKENYQNRIRPGMSSRITIDTTRYVRESPHDW
jgi:membrane fusion protein, multidrug efflux system